MQPNIYRGISIGMRKDNAMGKRKPTSRAGQAGRLFEAVIHRAKLAGDFDSAEPILDYCQPCTAVRKGEPKMKLDTSKFDFLPCLTFGSDGKLYLNCYLTRFNGIGYYSVRIGTLRTLNTDMDTCKIMGELCGALTFHAHQHLDEQHHCHITSLTTTEGEHPRHRRALVGKFEEAEVRTKSGR